MKLLTAHNEIDVLSKLPMYESFITNTNWFFLSKPKADRQAKI